MNGCARNPESCDLHNKKSKQLQKTSSLNLLKTTQNYRHTNQWLRSDQRKSKHEMNPNFINKKTTQNSN